MEAQKQGTWELAGIDKRGRVLALLGAAETAAREAVRLADEVLPEEDDFDNSSIRAQLARLSMDCGSARHTVADTLGIALWPGDEA